MALERFSEQYSPTGSVAAAGVLNTLGRPALHPLELLAREALQNCWDAAADPGIRPVDVTITCDDLEPGAVELISREVFSGAPDDVPVESALVASPRLLTISDRQTKGLAGPLRADAVVDGPTDFIDFVRNIGQPPDTAHGAGSFGYGKGAFFRVSRARAIIVYTRTRDESGSEQSRLMATALGRDSVEHRGGTSRRLTGRHWWGRIVDGIVDPVLDDDADDLAAAIGLPVMAKGEFGTTVAVVAPRLTIDIEDHESDEPDAGGDDSDAAMQVMARAVAWHFWPKLYAPTPSMQVVISRNGAAVPIPGPESDTRLRAFVNAKRRLDGLDPIEPAVDGVVEEIRSQRPKRLLGHLAIELHPLEEVPPKEVALAAPEAGGPPRHAALMRQAELVVAYLSGPDLALPNFGYVGVFRCAENLDQVFRDAEPPSHDDWVPDGLSHPHHRRYIRIAKREIKAKLRAFADRTMPAAGTDAEEVPLGAFAKELASLIATVQGPGASRKPASGGGGPRPKAPVKIVQPAVPHETEDGEVVLRAKVRATRPVVARAIPMVVVLDGGSVETEAPVGAKTPQVRRWMGPDGTQIAGDEARLAPNEDWIVEVDAIPDAVVRIDFEVDA